MRETPNVASPLQAELPSDAEIVARVCAGEVILFEILMRRHNQRVYRAVRAILRQENEVEDTMQQAYLSAYTHLATFKGTAKFSTWLTAIAVNEACGRLRRRRPQVVTEDGDFFAPHASAATPEDALANHELGRILEKSVDKLPEIYRIVFVLREVDGMGTAEVAGALDVSEDVIKTRLHRAREILQRELLAATKSATGEAFPFHATRCDRVVAGVLQALAR